MSEKDEKIDGEFIMDVCEYALTYNGKVFSLADDYEDACSQLDSWKKSDIDGLDLSLDSIAIAEFGKDIKVCHLNCTFCGKSHQEVKKLIAGPNVYICDECVELVVDIIREELDADFCKNNFGEKL